MNGYGTFWDWYAVAPYQFPLVDFQPVVRIPVVGPEPFNTLVVVRGRVFTTEGWTNGDLNRRRLAVGTNFQLALFDPRVPHPFRHSTTGVLQMIQQDTDASFVTAVDEVDGFFDDRGNWIIVAKVADMWDDGLASSSAYLSSWVLCYEPPPLPNQPRSATPKFENYHLPPRFWTLEALTASTSAADRRVKRFVRRNRRRKGRGAEGCPAEDRRAASPNRLTHPGMTVGAPPFDEGLPIVIPQTHSKEGEDQE